jgi:hypothetical protein
MKCGFFKPVEKKGFNFFDKILLGVIGLVLITYIVLISIYPYEQYQYNKINKINDPYINSLNIANNVIGLILGLLLSSMISGFILREFELNLIVTIIVFLVSLTVLIIYYVSKIEQHDDINWLKFTYAVVPLSSPLFLLTHYTFNTLYKDLFNYINKIPDDNLITSSDSGTSISTDSISTDTISTDSISTDTTSSKD